MLGTSASSLECSVARRSAMASAEAACRKLLKVSCVTFNIACTCYKVARNLPIIVASTNSISFENNFFAFDCQNHAV